MGEASDPTPGLRGTIEGTCIVCLRPTDTALAVEGQAEWHSAVLHVLGVPADEAMATVDRFGGSPGRGMRFEQMYRVCTECAECAGQGIPGGVPKPALAIPGEPTPVLTQRTD